MFHEGRLSKHFDDCKIHKGVSYFEWWWKMHVDSPCIDFGQETLKLTNVVQDVDLVMLCTTLF